MNAAECETQMRRMTEGERGCANPSEHLSRIERFLIRLGILATPEESVYLAAADERLDHIQEHLNWARRGYALKCGREGCDL